MYSNKDKILAISIYFITGSLLLFVIKFQGVQNVVQGDVQKKFFHPYMQSFIFFLGQTTYILFYLKQRRKWRKQFHQQKKPYSFTIFFIPAIADVFTSILQMIGLNFIPGSTFLMFKGSAIVTTMLFSKILLKKKLEKRHYIGCSLTIIGMVIVSMSSMMQENSSSSQNESTGYALMLISIIFNGFFYAYEEYLLKKYHINFYQMVASQGIYGGGIILCLAIVLSYIPCSFGERICVYDQSGRSYFQLPMVYLKQLSENMILLGLTLAAGLLIGVFILNGIKITKMFDGLTKSIINITKTTMVWAIGIIITLIGSSQNDDFRLQSLNIMVNVIKVIGFSVIICGNLIYNEIILKKYLSVEQKLLDKLRIIERVYSGSQQGEIIFSSSASSIVCKNNQYVSTKVQIDEDSLLQNLMMVKQDQIQ